MFPRDLAFLRGGVCHVREKRKEGFETLTVGGMLIDDRLSFMACGKAYDRDVGTPDFASDWFGGLHAFSSGLRCNSYSLCNGKNTNIRPALQ